MMIPKQVADFLAKTTSKVAQIVVRFLQVC